MNYIRIIDRMRQCVASCGGGFSESDLRTTAEQVAELCRQCVDRLDRCIELLHVGQRSEAVRLAQLAPNLDDVLKRLDVPEWPVWLSLCEPLGLPVPPLIPAEKVFQIRKAIVDEQNLRDLLRLWRSQALAGAPLSQRLRTLRQLALKDPDNAYWRCDIITYEEARFEEMKQQLRGFRQIRDLRSLEALYRELTSTAWNKPPPADLFAQVCSGLENVKRVFLEPYQGLLKQLEIACNQGNQEEFAAIRANIEQLFSTVHLPKNDPLVDRYQSIMARWEQERNAAQGDATRDQVFTNLSELIEGVNRLINELDQLAREGNT